MDDTATINAMPDARSTPCRWRPATAQEAGYATGNDNRY